MSKDGDIVYMKEYALPKFVEGVIATVVPVKHPRPLERLNRATFVATESHPAAVTAAAAVTASGSNTGGPVKAKKKPKAAATLEELSTLDFDVFSYEVDAVSGGGVFLEMVETIFEEGHKILTIFEIPVDTFRAWVSAVHANYHTENTYHNFRHAFNVLQTLHVFLSAFKLSSWFSDLQKFAMLFSALCHDLQHPGRNNSFLIDTEHDLAIRYNNQAVLENHHCAVAFALVKATPSGVCASSCLSVGEGSTKGTTPCDILKGLRGGSSGSARTSYAHGDKYREFRNLVIQCILSTEVASCKKRNESLKAMLDAGFDKDDASQVRLVASTLLEAADLSNEVRNFAFSRQWGPLVQEEFFAQGDEQAALGIPVPAVNDRRKALLAKDQQGFIKLGCIPMYELLVRMDSSFQVCLDNLKVNASTWKAMDPEGEGGS